MVAILAVAIALFFVGARSWQPFIDGFRAYRSMRTITLSPDGHLLASTHHSESEDRATLHLWNAVTGESLRKLRMERGNVPALLHWSGDGSRLQVVTREGRLLQWQTSTWDKPESFNFTVPLRGRFLTWSPDERWIVSLDNLGVLRLWETGTLELYYKRDLHHDYPTALVWSPDSTRVATSSADHTVKVIEAETGHLFFEFRDSLAPKPVVEIPPGSEREPVDYTVHHLTWSPDGTRLATAGHSGRVAILDGESGELLQSLEWEGPREPVRALAWSPDGAWLAVADGRSRLHLFETENWTRVYLEDTGAGYADYLVWSSSGRKVALGREEWVKVWTVPSGRSASLGTRQIYGDDLHVFAWSPDGERIFSYTLYGAEAQIWQIESGDSIPIAIPLWEALWHALF